MACKVMRQSRLRNSKRK